MFRKRHLNTEWDCCENTKCTDIHASPCRNLSRADAAWAIRKTNCRCELYLPVASPYIKGERNKSNPALVVESKRKHTAWTFSFHISFFLVPLYPPIPLRNAPSITVQYWLFSHSMKTREWYVSYMRIMKKSEETENMIRQRKASILGSLLRISVTKNFKKNLGIMILCELTLSLGDSLRVAY